MSRLLLCATLPGGSETRAILDRCGATVTAVTPELFEAEHVADYDLVVFEGSAPDRILWQLCRHCRLRLSAGLVPILALCADQAGRLVSLEAGADACLCRPYGPTELLAQVRALLRLKKLHDRSRQQTRDFSLANKKLRDAYQQVGQELDLARRIQRSLLPQTLPELPGVRFAVHYQPRGRVGGDFYDVFRLDEAHVCFYVADVMGHGVPACLLTMFLKKAVHAKEITEQSYRLVPPDEVLRRLNQEMLEQALAENPFITMVYGLYNFVDRSLVFARAGHPYPLLVPRNGPLRFLEVHGTLLGIFDTDYDVHTEKLAPGDKVLFYTDGLESADATAQTLLARVPAHGQQPIDAMVAQLAADLENASEQADDLTLFGLEVTSA